MLRDRLVCGVNHQGIQHKLLSEGDISYTDALAPAQSIESAEDDARKLGGPALFFFFFSFRSGVTDVGSFVNREGIPGIMPPKKTATLKKATVASSSLS